MSLAGTERPVVAFMRCGWTAYEVVRPMISRMRAGGLVVFFCVSVVLVPGETFGRGGSFGGRGFAGRSVPIGSRFRPPTLRPQAQLHRPGFKGPLRHRFGYGFFPLPGFGGGYYGPGYGAPNYVVPYDQPAETVPEITGAIPTPGSVSGGFRPVIVYRPGCQTQTVTVPSEDGDDRSINIVRC
jgi:hypothetical protein